MLQAEISIYRVTTKSVFPHSGLLAIRISVHKQQTPLLHRITCLNSPNIRSTDLIISLQIGLLMGWFQDFGYLCWSYPRWLERVPFLRQAPTNTVWQHSTKAAQPPSQLLKVLYVRRARSRFSCEYRRSDRRPPRQSHVPFHKLSLREERAC